MVRRSWCCSALFLAGCSVFSEGMLKTEDDTSDAGHAGSTANGVTDSGVLPDGAAGQHPTDDGATPADSATSGGDGQATSDASGSGDAAPDSNKVEGAACSATVPASGGYAGCSGKGGATYDGAYLATPNNATPAPWPLVHAACGSVSAATTDRYAFTVAQGQCFEVYLDAVKATFTVNGVGIAIGNHSPGFLQLSAGQAGTVEVDVQSTSADAAGYHLVVR